MSRWEVTFDVAGFSGFFVKSQTPALPMQMNSFSGTKVNGANRLVWNTKNEINTKQFLIEWSKDAANWNRLGIVAATGNNNNTYNYNHTNEPTGKIFYRLKMIDQDGQFTYSDLIWLNGSDNTSIIIYPNPVKSVVNLNIAKELLGTHVSLLTVDGKLLQSIIITSDQQAINVALLPSGIYMLTFADGTIEKFIKE